MGELPDQASQASHPLAQRYADGTVLARAVPVFPLVPGGKIPLIPSRRGGRGVLDATVDRDRIAAWWRASPEANIGLGLAGGRLAVLDIEGPSKGLRTVAGRQRPRAGVR